MLTLADFAYSVDGPSSRTCVKTFWCPLKSTTIPNDNPAQNPATCPQAPLAHAPVSEISRAGCWGQGTQPEARMSACKGERAMRRVAITVEVCSKSSFVLLKAHRSLSDASKVENIIRFTSVPVPA